MASTSIVTRDPRIFFKQIKFVTQAQLLTIPKDKLLEYVQLAFPNFKIWYSSSATRETIVPY